MLKHCVLSWHWTAILEDNNSKHGSMQAQRKPCSAKAHTEMIKSLHWRVVQSGKCRVELCSLLKVGIIFLSLYLQLIVAAEYHRSRQLCRHLVPQRAKMPWEAQQLQRKALGSCSESFMGETGNENWLLFFFFFFKLVFSVASNK